MISQQQISDRFELQDLVTRYCHIIDGGNYDELKSIFADDAHIDYTAMGGIAGSRSEIIEFLKQVMPRFSAAQHMISNYLFDFSEAGDSATGRIMCLNSMQPAGEEQGMFFLGLWYVDEYIRTEAGWRISTRSEEKSWSVNK